MVCIYHIFFICSSVNGHLGFLSHVLAIVNSAAANTGVLRSFQEPDFILLDIYPEVRWLFEELSYYFPEQLHHFGFPPTVCKDSSFSTSSPTLVVFCFFW